MKNGPNLDLLALEDKKMFRKAAFLLIASLSWVALDAVVTFNKNAAPQSKTHAAQDACNNCETHRDAGVGGPQP